MNKDILFISNFIGNGGVGRVIVSLAESFANLEYKVTVLSFDHNGYTYPIDSRVTNIVHCLQQTTSILKRYERLTTIRKVIRENPNAVIVAFEHFINIHTIIASIGLKRKIVISERNDPAQWKGRIFINAIRNFLYRYCDTLICQTDDAKQYFPAYIQKKTSIILNPITNYLPTRECPLHRDNSIVSFGRLEKQKNLLLLIDAFEIFFQNHSNYQLKIYGDGKEKNNIEQYIKIKHLSQNVFLYEATSNVHAHIINSSMYVSSSDYEGLSNSMLEAMAIGLPVICTDCPCGGARMVIKNYDNGILVPVRNTERLAEAMSEIADNYELSNMLSIRARRIREYLAPDKITAQWIQVIEALGKF